jgi:hypothetical protein
MKAKAIKNELASCLADNEILDFLAYRECLNPEPPFRQLADADYNQNLDYNWPEHIPFVLS